ncbi:MAG: FAD-dependent oxidoreductase, partial [Archangium sp.]|nr:FAD-dependent oxidoreductase [Archangium sp.]
MVLVAHPSGQLSRPVGWGDRATASERHEGQLTRASHGADGWWPVKIIVVGGGIMGLSIALELRKRNDIEVVVLEKSVPGAEAS